MKENLPNFTGTCAHIVQALPKKFCNTIFLLLVSLVPARNKSVYPFLVPVWILYSQTLLQQPHRHSQTFSHRWRLWGLQRGGNLRVQDLGCIVGVEERFVWVLWLLPLFLNLCVVVHCYVEGGFSNIFVRSNSPEMLLQGFKSECTCGLTTWHNVYQNHPFCISKKKKQWSGRHVSLSSAWPFSEHAIREAQRLMVPFSTTVTLYTFFNHSWMFVSDSFSSTRNSITAHCLAHVWENVLFRGAAVASGK